MKTGRQIGMVGILVLGFAAVSSSADWYYEYSDTFATDKAQQDSYDHSVFWPETAFPPAEPWLYFSSLWGDPPRGLVFRDFLGTWAHLNYCFPLPPAGPGLSVSGAIQFDVGYLPDETDAYLCYSISPDGVHWTIPIPLEPGRHRIPLASSQATCHIALQGTKAFIDNLKVHLASPPPDIRVPEDYDTIQEAIDAAGPGQIIEVGPAIYRGDGNRDLDFGGKSITVRSLMGPEDTIIDCQEESFAEPARHRGFYFHNGEGRDSVLRGFTIRNGFIPGSELPPLDEQKFWPSDPDLPVGGGIYCHDAGPTIENCLIEKCHTELGGGIGCVGGGALIRHCRILDCRAGGVGPCESGGLGGGIGLVHTAGLEIHDSAICRNNGYYNSHGGGIYVKRSPDVTITRSTIAGNSADGNITGGGLYCGPGCDVRLQQCLIHDNTAQSGAGIFTENGPDITLTTTVVANCTLADNHLDDVLPPLPGAAIHSAGSDIQIRNSIIWHNDHPQMVLIDPPLESPVVYSNVQSGWLGAGNLDVNPLFADRAEADYHLQSIAGRFDPVLGQWVHDERHSMSIDAGDPSDPVADEPLPNGQRINQGAYGGTDQASMSRGAGIEPVILFSTEESFTAVAGPHAAQAISHGDLLDTRGRVAARNTHLTRHFHPEPPPADYGLDGVDLGAAGNIQFSLEESFWDELLARTVSQGDWLSDTGLIRHTNAWLLRNFHPMPPMMDYGLDAIGAAPHGLVFSIEEGFFDESLGVHVGHGDLLSPAGTILMTNQYLLRNFHPMPSPEPHDYGLDAVHVLHSGEVWFSIEQTFWDESLGRWIGHGDLLSDTGRVVKTNAELLAPFFGDALFVPGDLGLDALWIGPGCVRPPSADLNHDCRVDLRDLAIMAGQWLQCGWEPPELCNP
ncbi:MAG: right-handed parallel beta-helix repeat-containing protein [Sedimentisphaerales bacterium]|nr:right-handed parallel beta-helix repeat-containing protein [Sedimentisphaerales bacterium]